MPNLRELFNICSCCFNYEYRWTCYLFGGQFCDYLLFYHCDLLRIGIGLDVDCLEQGPQTLKVKVVVEEGHVLGHDQRALHELV